MTKIFAVGDLCYLGDETGRVEAVTDLGDGLWQVRVRHDTTGVEYAYEVRHFYPHNPGFGFFWKSLLKSRTIKAPVLMDPVAWMESRLRVRFYQAHTGLGQSFERMQRQGHVESQTLLVAELERLAEKFGA